MCVSNVILLRFANDTTVEGIFLEVQQSGHMKEHVDRLIHIEMSVLSLAHEPLQKKTILTRLSALISGSRKSGTPLVVSYSGMRVP